MKVHVLRKRSRSARRQVAMRIFESFFLVFGLAALDIYIWNNTSVALYQTYDNSRFERSRPPEVRQLSRNAPGVSLTLSPFKPAAPQDVIGRLRIPSLHLTVMVREGADAATLQRAVGHIPGTALPGQIGNIGLAGHRDSFFRPLRNIRTNDSIELETVNGTYRYAVESARIVGPRDVQVLASSRSRTLTLVTCYPFYYVGSAPNRFVVRAVLVPPITQLTATR